MTLVTDPVFDKGQIVRVSTIYDLAKAAGLTTAAVRWPATRNAHSLDRTIPDCGTDALMVGYTAPAPLQECVAAGITPAVPESDAPVGPADDKPGPTRFGDPAAVDAFTLVLRTHRPDLALLHISDLDHAEHLDGPRSPKAYAAVHVAAVHVADAQVGRVWDELRRQLPGRATLLVLSDHGFSPISRTVLPNVVLRDAGLLQVKGVRVVGGPVRGSRRCGDAVRLEHRPPRRDRPADHQGVRWPGRRREGRRPVRDVGVRLCRTPVDPHAPDRVVFADEGYAFGDTAGGAPTFNEKPERKGTHGHDPHLPDLRATFVAGGAGIRPGVTLGLIPNTAVAPTMAALLWMPMENVDGRALNDCLTTTSAPTATTIAGSFSPTPYPDRGGLPFGEALPVSIRVGPVGP